MRNSANIPQGIDAITSGALLRHWRNEVKVELSYVSETTGISIDRLGLLESGGEIATYNELEKLSEIYCVSVRDLLPSRNDLDRGISILRHVDARNAPQSRAGRLQYTYWERAMSAMIPNFKPVELELHLHDRDAVQLNRGHFFHQFTQVLHGGPVATLWKEGETVHEEVFAEGDSFLIPGFVPHGFYSPEEENGKILAITFGQYLASSDARAEMSLIGKDNLARIVEDDEYYTK